MKNNKIVSTLLIILIYVLAFVAGYYTTKLINIENALLLFLVADIVATIVVYLGSLIFNNTSVYDPYWSVAPMVMAPLFALFINAINPFTITIIVIIEIWGIRLTLNWFKRFKNLNYEDWRYNKFKQKYNKFIYQLINLFGFHLMPTLVVYVAMLPVFSYINQFIVSENLQLNGTFFICIVVSLIAIVIETIADLQMDKFKKDENNIGKINRNGLWKVSRHPNYFGEILFWFSMFLFDVSIGDELWILIFSPLIMFLLFACISIPLLEKRQLTNKPEYAEYKKETNMLLPIFPKEKK